MHVTARYLKFRISRNIYRHSRFGRIIDLFAWIGVNPSPSLSLGVI